MSAVAELSVEYQLIESKNFMFKWINPYRAFPLHLESFANPDWNDEVATSDLIKMYLKQSRADNAKKFCGWIYKTKVKCCGWI